jgi:hypothetical protein
MPEKLKIGYKDGTSETLEVPTEDEQIEYEKNLINQIPDDLLQMFGVSKKAMLKHYERP